MKQPNPTPLYDQDDLREAIRVLRAGGVILYPTDTVWGIGCDATNADAVQRIFRLKQREEAKSMLVLMDSPNLLTYYLQEVPDTAWQLLDATAPDEDGQPLDDQRPLTIIYPHARHLAPNLIAEDGSVGIRITYEPFSQALCRGLHHPIVSTSANISGQPTAATFDEISEDIRLGCDYICRYRQDDLTPHIPSSIIKIDDHERITIIR